MGIRKTRTFGDIVRLSFKIPATDRAAGRTKSPIDFPTSRKRGRGVIAHPERIVGKPYLGITSASPENNGEEKMIHCSFAYSVFA
jgi:hypothetical protein